MKIYQPMLFVGLGGTGGKIGTELERSLRRDLCGPDGTDLIDGGRRLPFQLPDCLQFVYADFSEAELLSYPQFKAKGAEGAAFARTSRIVRDLLPTDFDSSPEVTRMLRVTVPVETRLWLPPQARQPRVAPLNSGAGQLPTVGRSALFATLRSGLEPVLRQLREAIGAIGQSAGDLRRVGGGRIRGCDVFVAFSVAGGTGAGIFYDFIHLIGHEFRNAGVPGVKIYPLVVMPSAFPPEGGGGREAELNSARALVDLSRLVDDQNVPDALDQVGDVEDRGRLSVTYPGDGVVALRPATMQTAFLFSKPSVINGEDLRRSIAAMVMSLIGTDLGQDTGSATRAEDDYQSFAASFINKSVERSTPARTGIGYRGMSTSLAASLTVPVDDLAEIVAARLLAQAVRGMTERARRPDREGQDHVRELFNRSAIGRLWTRDAPDVPLPEQIPRGKSRITQELRNRLGDMEEALRRLDAGLAREIPRLTEDFRPSTGVRELLGSMDPFQVEVILTGLPGHPDRVAREGFTGMIDNRRNEPERPPNVHTAAPGIPPIKGAVGGVVPARWNDPDVQDALAAQQAWYQWRARTLWHHGWQAGESQWRPALHKAGSEVAELTKALRAHEQDEPKAFADSRRGLYRDDRAGIAYLLPPQNTLRAFYDDVIDRLAQSEGLPEAADAATLLGRLVGPDDWRRALDAVRRQPGAAVKEIKQVVERRVKRLFGEANEDAFARPLLPSMELLLRAAAGDETAEAKIDPRWLDQFRSRLAGLIPVGFVPDGSGPLKILIVHPASESDGRARDYLEQALNLPGRVTPESRAGDTDAITVVFFRSGMNLTDISEVRNILSLWSEARDSAGEDDFLHWRQRLGYQDDWLVSTEHDRQRILHRLLCAMWNGHIDTEGPAGSPHRVRIRLQDGESATMTLRLEDFDGSLTSWAGLLRAYERWALLDEGQIIEQFCERLMQALPKGLAQVPVPPSPLFTHFVEQVAPRQLGLIDRLVAEYGEYGETDTEWLAPIRHFWEVTFPGALDMRFPRAARATRASLRALYERHASRAGVTQGQGQGQQGPGQVKPPGQRQGHGQGQVQGHGYGQGPSHGHRPAQDFGPQGAHRREGYEYGPGPVSENGVRPEWENRPGPGSENGARPEWENRPAPGSENGARPAYGNGTVPDPRTAYGNGDAPGPGPGPAAGPAAGSPQQAGSSAFEEDWEQEPEPDFGPYDDDGSYYRDRAGEAE
ncbi:tubulin-like doman-containing protein [Streptomyces sp. NBC_00572]|uniref:tubulin-like doman-containing protein n=1 Tax=Streptomyces sp. NBC_00572 TaxID=2903664 RepID=UPI0022566AFF|nr:tubulin-like doman-containing protein [Streptomyces sp. NBC_00572]MCX4984110.1 tubulin-like doman-containing protein [Streptomyces sp. NBC_00572]